LSQLALIVTISVITAVVVGSTVFFVWTLAERLAGRKSADVTENEEQPEPEEPQQEA